VSSYVEKLKAIARELEQDGYVVTSETVLQCANRMDEMEKLIVSMKKEVEEKEHDHTD